MEDPIQFVTQVYDTYYDCSNVRSDAGDFLVYLSKVRANDILNPFLNFLMGLLRHVHARPPPHA